MQKIQLHGLSEIRGVAALLVLISHIDQFHDVLKIPSIGLSKTGVADHAVTIFFVLSGFLITYLLLIEKDTYQKISIKKFYIRRVLRIWPAYYIVIVASLLLIYFGIFTNPGIDQLIPAMIAFITMTPNIGYVLSLTFSGTSPLWSIGVEEQFYLVWPWIINKVKFLGIFLIILIISYLILRLTAYYFKPTSGVYLLIKLTRFDCMSIGGLVALGFHFQNIKFRKIIFHSVTQIFSLVCLIIPILIQIKLYADLQIEVYAIASAVFIANTVYNNESKFKLRSKILRFFGEISYGLYVYHLIIIYLIGKLNLTTSTIGIYFLVIFASAIASYLSYHLVELKFLKFKSKFSKIETANS